MGESLDSSALCRSFDRIDPLIRRPLEKALSGEPIGATDAENLIQLPKEQLAPLLAVAGHIRNRLKGLTVTYSPKVFLPITNLCLDRCHYCTFRKDPGSPEAWTMLPEEVERCCTHGRSVGAVEALLCLGDKPERAFSSYRQTLQVLGHETTVSYVEACCKLALRTGLLPHTNAGLLARDEMSDLKRVNASMGLMLENSSTRLMECGGAHHNAPDKHPALRIKMIREAGELQIPFTTGILIGIGETLSERVDSLDTIRRLHAEHGHIQEVIIQNFRAKPRIQMASEPEPDSYDMARTIAVARLMLRDMNIQAPPNLSPYDHRLFLSAGINDWGGISPLTPDYVNPEAPWPHVTALAATCRAEGITLEPRLPVYAEYLTRPGFLSPEINPHVQSALQRLRDSGGSNVRPSA
jgi:FO synthase